MANCSDSYNNVCRQDIPYPQVSPESVPSLIDNLVTALYGAFYNPQTQQGYVTKSVVNGRVVWTSACDPNNSATVPGVPRQDGEGLLCYIMRIFALYSPTEYIKLTGPQTITNSTFANGTIDSCTFINPIGLTKADVGLGNVDDTADLNKPISGPQTTAVNNAISAALAGFVPTTVASLSGGVAGSVPYQSAPSVTALLPPGTAGFVLRSNGPGLAPSWAVNSTVSASADDINGGAAGEILYQTIGSTTGFLSAGTNNYVLKSNGVGNAPTWVLKAPQAVLADTATKANNIDGGAYGDILWQSAANTTSKLSAGSAGSVLRTGIAPSTAPSWTPTATAGTANTLALRDASGNLAAATFNGNLSGNANTATGLQSVPGLTPGIYGGTNSYPVLTVTSGGQITAASSQPAPLLTTVQRFQETKTSYMGLHRSTGGQFIIDSDNRVRYFGQAQSFAGASPSFSWINSGAGTASLQSLNSGGMIISPEYLSGEYAVKVYSHQRATWILTNAGNLYAAGENTIGQLGLGFVGGTTVFPRRVSGIGFGISSNIIDFCVSQGQQAPDQLYCIAIISDGSVYTWGYNAFGNCGNGTTTNVFTPTDITAINNINNPIFGKKFDKCYAGGLPGYCFLIERTTKAVFATGYNGYNCLGLNNGGANVVWFNPLPAVAGSPTTADEIFTSGGLVPVVNTISNHRATSFILLNGEVYSTGSDVSGETGQGTLGTPRSVFTKIIGLSNIVEISLSSGYNGSNEGGGMSVAARSSGGQFWVWGNNAQGQLGNNPVTTPTASSVPLAYTDLEYVPSANSTSILPWPSAVLAQKIRYIGGPENTTWGVRGFILDNFGQIWVAGKFSVASYGDGYNRTGNQVVWRPVRQNGIVFTDFDVVLASFSGPETMVFAKDNVGQLWFWGANTANSVASTSGGWTQTPQRIFIG